MKKVIYSFLLIIYIIPCYISADEYATTDSGRQVLLKDDGTWKYIEKILQKISSSKWEVIEQIDPVDDSKRIMFTPLTMLGFSFDL